MLKVSITSGKGVMRTKVKNLLQDAEIITYPIAIGGEGDVGGILVKGAIDREDTRDRG
ncbi:MAG: hypothetical protein AAGD22_07170 [Verrucomicrobiota bacterium]